MMTKSDIESILGAKTVSFNSLFAKATGSVTAAVFLSQAVFWQEKAKFKGSIETAEFDGEKYFSKTAAEWYDETGLSTEQQKTARKPLVSSGILKEKRAGLPAKMFFRVDIEALVSGISAYLNEGVTVCGFPANRKPENPRTLRGKFRKQEAGNSSNTNKEGELKESLESKKERGAALPLFSSSSPENETLEAEKKENGLQTGAPPPPKKDYGSLCPDCHGVGWHIGRNGRETCETCLGNGLNSKKLLSPPFIPVGTIEPQGATVIRMYDPQLPAVTIVDSVPATTHAQTEFRRVNIGEEIERLKTDAAAKETFTLSRKIPSNLFVEYVEAFAKEVGGTGETYHNLTAFRKHFFNWSGTRYEITQKRQTQTNGKGSSLTRAGGDLSKYEGKQLF